ncbi:ABC transporter permease [Nevskia soli]|uniref:ABC transporter permease n=1 Tax=Nevskia soli TaxID=418856 RepID=UPI0004A6C168|nr:FtsX-like permease family protein [Nevskia soli]
MKYVPLVWAALWRRKARTIFTLLSLTAAFLLLGMLQAANSLFSGGSVNLSAPIMIVQARVSFTSPLPMRLLPQLEAIPEVESVSHSQFFGGIYKDVRNFFPQFAVNPERWHRTFLECRMPDAQYQAWLQSRTGAIAGRLLADRFGWKIGDRIPLTSQIWPLKDGSRAWTFDLVGIFDDVSKDSCVRQGNLYVRYDYFDEGRQFGQGGAGIYVLRLHDPNQAEAVARRVDAMFENSPDETKTQTEKDFSLNFLRQLGNLNLILTGITVAVFFSILLVTGNTISQAVRERIPELAVLKTIGFGDGSVLNLVLAESLLMCVIGGLAGMLLSLVVLKVISKLPFGFPPVTAGLHVWLFAAASMVGLGLVVGILPAMRARNLSIIDALAVR